MFSHPFPAIRAVFALVLIPVTALFAETPSAPPPALPINHEFDFWLGDWDVVTPDGKPAGTNRVESVSGGRGLLENWVAHPAAGGGNGKSLNCYNAAKQQWQQFWVGSGGGVLELAGGFADGKMVLTGTHRVGGRNFTERISWRLNPDGTVRQYWEQSPDGGKTWNPIFEGIYRRKR
jgi:hypothetical protein